MPDPVARPFKGFDCMGNTRAKVPALVAAGYSYAGRYYCKATNPKILTPEEAQALSAAGIRIFVVWENGGSADGYQAGLADGLDAIRYAQDVIHQPAGSAIYFAVDHDPAPGELQATILPYFQGVAAAFAGGAPYQLGVYGAGAVCQAVVAAGLAGVSWLSCSTAWQGFKDWEPYCHIRQYLGTELDPDDVSEDCGAFLVP